MAETISQNNKRIAKNTLFLYLRMFLIMAVSLYTSRVILQTLGVDDYGVYNVVGGFVTMLAYLNSVFVDATQRFLSFTLGENNLGKLRKVFTTSISIHFIIAGIILLFAETFGLWFVNCKLNIDPERLVAANWVYQCSIISLVITIINVPHRACIVSHEHMHIYAYISIVEVLLKLGIVFLLLALPYDKLIAYAVLHLIASIVIPIWYTIYSIKHFEESRVGFGIEKSVFKEMFSYAGWVLVGNLGFSFKDQLSNIIMNLFLGTAINAARGIAGQVNGIITSFANNFMMALSPQITKQYAAGDIEQSQKLVCAGARYSFYLMAIVSIPIILNIDYILHLWLGIVPDYTSEFVVITLIAAIYYASTKTLTVAIQATGDIKWFQIGISAIMLLEIPIAYVVLKLQLQPHYALLPAIFTTIIGLFYRLFILKKQVPAYGIRRFVMIVFIRCSLLMLASYIISVLFCRLFSESFLTLIITSLFSCLVSCILIYFFGINQQERKVVNGFVNTKILKRQ